MEQEERRQGLIGNPTSGKEVNNVRDKIQLKSSHWPSREELLKKAAEGLVIRCPRSRPASMRRKRSSSLATPTLSCVTPRSPCAFVSDGTSQEKFLYLLREIEEEARNHWESFRLFAVLDGRLTK